MGSFVEEEAGRKETDCVTRRFELCSASLSLGRKGENTHFHLFQCQSENDRTISLSFPPLARKIVPSLYTVPPRASQCCMFYLLILARLCFDYLKALALLRLRPNGAPPPLGTVGRSGVWFRCHNPESMVDRRSASGAKFGRQQTRHKSDRSVTMASTKARMHILSPNRRTNVNASMTPVSIISLLFSERVALHSSSFLER